MKKSVLILSYHFYPSAEIGARRPSELASSLEQAGWEVTVVAAKSKRKIRVDPDLQARAEGFNVVRVTDPPSLETLLVRWIKKILGRDQGHTGKWELPEPSPDGESPEDTPRGSLWQTSKRYYFSIRHLFGHNKAWASLAFARLLPLLLRRRYSVVLCSGPPMPPHIVAVAASKLARAKFVMDMRDPWFLDDMVAPQYQSQLRRSLDRRFERVCYRSANLIVCTSPGAARHVSERCPEVSERTRVVFNGYDHRPVDVQPIPTGSLRLLYAGAIYFNRNPFPLFEALQRLLGESGVDRGKIRFRLFGHCSEWQGQQLQPWLEERQLTDIISVHGPVGLEEVARQISAANVLVNFAQGQPDQIPAKTFEQMVSGRETLVVSEADSDTAGVIRESATGRVVAPGDIDAIKSALHALYRRYAEQQSYYAPSEATLRSFSREHQNALYLEELQQLIES